MNVAEIIKIGAKAGYKASKIPGYGKKRIKELKEKGYNDETIEKMIYFEIGLSTVATLSSAGVAAQCAEPGVIAGAEIGGIAGPAGAFWGGLAGGLTAPLACGAGIGKTALEVSKKLSENIFNNSNYPEKQEVNLKDIQSYITNLDNSKSNNSLILKGGVEQNVLLGGIENNFTREQISGMDSRTLDKNWDTIMNQMKTAGIPSDKDFSRQDLSKYSNPELAGSNRIFTREEIGNMNRKEFAKYEKAIDHQMKTIGIPTEAEVKKAGIKSEVIPKN